MKIILMKNERLLQIKKKEIFDNNVWREMSTNNQQEKYLKITMRNYTMKRLSVSARSYAI